MNHRFSTGGLIQLSLMFLFTFQYSLCCLKVSADSLGQLGIGQSSRLTKSEDSELTLAQETVHNYPRDFQKRFAYAELLRKSGNLHKAAPQYLEVIALEPSYYLAYHQLLKSKPTADQLEEAIERLTKLQELKPKELMLRVAISELLEEKGDYYRAARSLVDLQYEHVIPEKYVEQVNTRVHYLLTKAKDRQMVEKAQQSQEESDASPLPLPDTTLQRDLSAAKLKDTKMTEGYGHTNLLP